MTPELASSADNFPVMMPGQQGVQVPDQPPAVPGPGYPPADHVYPDRCQMPMPGTPSSFNQNLMLSSSPQYSTESTIWPVGWSEARPMMGYGWDGMQLLPSGLPIGSTSGTYNFLALPPSPQSSIGSMPPYQPQPQPPSSGPLPGSPAFCFHCLQYGAVFTINPV